MNILHRSKAEPEYLRESLAWMRDNPEHIAKDREDAKELYTLATFLFSEQSPHEIKSGRDRFLRWVEAKHDDKTYALLHQGDDDYRLVTASHKYPFDIQDMTVVMIEPDDYESHPFNSLGFRRNIWTQDQESGKDRSPAATSVGHMLNAVKEGFFTEHINQ